VPEPDSKPTGPEGEGGDEARGAARELTRLFLRLGVTAFGGPAAHIAMMHDEVVRRRRWVSDERFVDLVGATNSPPVPTAPSWPSTSAGTAPGAEAWS
jgi:chromate transporter